MRGWQDNVGRVEKRRAVQVLGKVWGEVAVEAEQV